MAPDPERGDSKSMLMWYLMEDIKMYRPDERTKVKSYLPYLEKAIAAWVSSQMEVGHAIEDIVMLYLFKVASEDQILELCSHDQLSKQKTFLMRHMDLIKSKDRSIAFKAQII